MAKRQRNREDVKPGTLVYVRRQWNDHRIAAYRIEDVRGAHWDDISGGVQAPAPQPFIHAYVLCNGMVDGELPHSGMHGGPCPHRIKVVILKKDNSPEVYQYFAEQAGPRPAREKRGARTRQADGLDQESRGE